MHVKRRPFHDWYLMMCFCFYVTWSTQLYDYYGVESFEVYKKKPFYAIAPLMNVERKREKTNELETVTSTPFSIEHSFCSYANSTTFNAIFCPSDLMHLIKLCTTFRLCTLSSESLSSVIKKICHISIYT